MRFLISLFNGCAAPQKLAILPASKEIPEPAPEPKWSEISGYSLPIELKNLFPKNQKFGCTEEYKGDLTLHNVQKCIATYDIPGTVIPFLLARDPERITKIFFVAIRLVVDGDPEQKRFAILYKDNNDWRYALETEKGETLVLSRDLERGFFKHFKELADGRSVTFEGLNNPSYKETLKIAPKTE